MKAQNFVLAALLIGLLSLGSVPGGRWPFINLVCAIDSYNDDINNVEVWQDNGGTWELVANYTATGGSTRIHDGWAVSFVVQVKLNDTLASTASEAHSFTRCYMNITTGIWTDALLNDTGTPSSSGGFWWVQKLGNWTDNLPAAGVTYYCNVSYQGYY